MTTLGFKDKNGGVYIFESEFEIIPSWAIEMTPLSSKEIISLQTQEKTVEQLAEEYRAKRDALLSVCDWTQVSDAPVDQAAWKVYRQALRDIPEQKNFPANIVWPNQPE